jgi:hypothetical protein
MADDSKTIKIPLFDGKSKNFVMWWIRFKAYSKVMGLHQALNVDPEPDLPVTQKDGEQLDQKDAGNKKAIDAMNRNDRALSNLAVAFTTAKAMVHLHKAGSTEWPDGLASNVVKSLMRKYRPQDLISGIEYENAL